MSRSTPAPTSGSSAATTRQFKESDDAGKSLAADRRQKAKTKSKSGQGDGGDR